MASRLTTSDIVQQIAQLDSTRKYAYASGRSELRIIDVTLPEGPIRFERMGQSDIARTGSISVQQIARIALVCSNKPNYPLHMDRLFSAGGNSRSAFETLLLNTPNFFLCFPQRVDAYSGEILTNLKHIMWCPDEAHEWGTIARKPYQETITEVELGIDFGKISVTQTDLKDEFDSIEAKTTHTQMQIALIEIGNALNFRSWIASGDRSIRVRDTQLGKLSGVIPSLEDIPLFYDPSVRQAAAYIDCIWVTEDLKRIPAAIEIEHTTGVTSGLTRLLKLHENAPSLKMNFTVVAPNNLRNKVTSEANQAAFAPLDGRYMPYSTVRELYGLIQRYQLANVVDYKFVEPFMEKVVRNR